MACVARACFGHTRCAPINLLPVKAVISIVLAVSLAGIVITTLLDTVVLRGPPDVIPWPPGSGLAREYPDPRTINRQLMMTAGFNETLNRYSDECGGPPDSLSSIPHVRFLKESVSIPMQEYDSHFTVVVLTKLTDVSKIISVASGYADLEKVRSVVVVPVTARPDQKEFQTEILDKSPAVKLKLHLSHGLTHFLKSLNLYILNHTGIFFVDDDIVVHKDDIYRAFSVWKHHPFGIVGFLSRQHLLLTSSGSIAERLTRYQGYHYPHHQGRNVGAAQYSMIDTAAAFVHVRLLTHVHGHVLSRSDTNCDASFDIMVNLVASHACQCSAAFLVTSQTPGGVRASGGGAALAADNSARELCFNDMAKHFRPFPLKYKSCLF